MQNEPNPSHDDTVTHRYKIYKFSDFKLCYYLQMSQFYPEASEKFNQAQNNPFSPPEDSKQMSPPVLMGGN